MIEATPASPGSSIDELRTWIYSAVLSDVLDAAGFRQQSPRVSITSQTGCSKLIGRCKTTLWADMAHIDPRPYQLELQSVDSCQPGEIVVAAAGGSMRSGIWGELLSTAARNRGCVGAIVDGAVRDVEKMTEMPFAVFARGRCCYDSLHRQRVVDLDVSVEIDGVKFSPGDLIVADTDGIVVIPRAVENDVIQRAWDKVHAENVTRAAITRGMKASEAYAKFGVL